MKIHRALDSSASRDMAGFSVLNDGCTNMEARQIQSKLWRKDSNVKLHLSLTNPHFQAGGMLRGNIQVETRNSEVQLSSARVTLMGSEGNSPLDSANGAETVGKFLPNRRAFLLQPGCVLEHDDVIDANFKHGAIMPITTFDFELELRRDLPSTFLHPWAALRYVVFW